MGKKQSRTMHPVLRAFLGLTAGIVSVVSLAVTAVLVYTIVLQVGVSGRNAPAAVSNSDVLNKFHMFVTNNISDALDGTLAIEKHYWIGEKELVAPKPNKKCFGQTDDPASLQWLLDEAKELLGDQTLYFSTDAAILEGSVVRYYLDDTIFAVTWKQPMDYMVYTFSEIKVAHPSQFRRFLAGGEYGSDKLFLTTEMAEAVNAVVATSGDYYRFRNAGIVVYDGIVRRANNGIADTCFVDRSGNLHFSRVNDFMDMEQAQKYVDENDISYSLVFGPVLIQDGEIIRTRHYMLGEIDEEYARSGLCQMGELHYLLATANSEGQYKYVPTIYQFSKRLQETGCKQAYALDGGQTAAIVMNNELINRVVYGHQRKISDILYFATAIPNGG